MWQNKFKSCENCNTISYKHVARGYCKNCYPLILRIEKINKWSYTNIDDIKFFDSIYYQKITVKRFEQIKRGLIKELSNRLEWFKTSENKIRGYISGLDLENGFNTIAEYCNVRSKNLFHGSANTFDHNFSQIQKKIIYEFIDRIERDRKWKGVDWLNVYSYDN